jgi:hypothetical protein
MDYPPPAEEVKILAKFHPELSTAVITRIVDLATKVRSSGEIAGGLSVRATDEACMYIKHPLFENQPQKDPLEILKSSFCGRFPGRWDDVTSDAGAAWALLQGGKKRS